MISLIRLCKQKVVLSFKSVGFHTVEQGSGIGSVSIIGSGDNRAGHRGYDVRLATAVQVERGETGGCIDCAHVVKLNQWKSPSPPFLVTLDVEV